MVPYLSLASCQYTKKIISTNKTTEASIDLRLHEKCGGTAVSLPLLQVPFQSNSKRRNMEKKNRAKIK